MTTIQDDRKARKVLAETQAPNSGVGGDAAPVIVGRDLAATVGGKGARRDILKGVNVQINRGEVVGLIGPNGAGKSTLLALLSGDLAPSEGEVLLEGKTYRELGDRAAARMRSVMMQDTRVSFSYTVRDVVTMGRSAWQKNNQVDRAKVDAALREVGLERFCDRDITTLSGGERARAALARVIAQEAQCVMLDEPTAAMDIGHSEKTMKTVRRLAESGRAVLVVLHDLETAARHCDRLVFLARGGVYAQGTPREVLTSELLTEIYGWPVEATFTEAGPWIRPVSE